MKLLVDTHLALWTILDNPRLGRDAKAVIGDPVNQVFVSALSLWEIAIKHALGDRGPDPIRISAHRAWERFGDTGFTILPVEARHAAAVDHLPLLHGDPFDRLLVAQAIAEPMRLLTRDRRLRAYSELVEIV